MMKKIFFVLMMCALSATTVVAGKIKRIDPTDWFVGMKNAKLQLMVYGESIGKAQVYTAWPGVRIDSVVRLDSPNYLLVYLDLSDAKAGNMPLVFTQGKQK